MNSIIKTSFDDIIINTYSNDWGGKSIGDGNIWEPHISFFLKRNLKPNSVLVDVGSNYGWHSIKNSKYCEMVYSFEPQKYMYNIQKMNINENKIININLINCGLGDKNENTEMAPIDYDLHSVPMGDLSIGSGGENVILRTLDSFEIPNVDFMKIDVQGYEKFVLNGSIETINNNKPTIIIEIEEWQLRRFGYGSEELFKLIRDYGYYIYFLEYKYQSDHLCVHKDNLDVFLKNNSNFVKELTESNNINHNMENGVTEKIIYE